MDEFWPTWQVAQHLGVSEAKLRRLLNEGVVTAPVMGDVHVWPVARLAEYEAAVAPHRADRRFTRRREPARGVRD